VPTAPLIHAASPPPLSEDYYWQSAKPQPPNLVAPQPFRFEQNDFASPSFQPDADFWTQLFTCQHVKLFTPQPWQFEALDSGGLESVPTSAFGSGTASQGTGEGESQDAEGSGGAVPVSANPKTRIVSGTGTVCG
jgi:hypothetical protein